MIILKSNSNASPYLRRDKMPIYKIGKTKKEGLQKYGVRINYISDSGEYKQITRTVYGVDEAKYLERRLEHEIKVQKESPVKKMTVKELFDEYISVKKYEVRETTLDKSTRILERYILPVLEDVRIDKLGTNILQEWKIYIEEKKLSLTSKRNIFGEFRAMLNYAVRLDYIPKHYLTKVRKFQRLFGHEKRNEILYSRRIQTVH
jgi:hypothetical protein